ncbi:MAG: hypothetical protein AB7O80_06075 [Acetobacteraceae bacterium]
MPDDPANNLRQANLLVIPAVLVRQGDDPGPLLRGMIGNPVELPCRIELPPDGAPAHGVSTPLPLDAALGQEAEAKADDPGPRWTANGWPKRSLAPRAQRSPASG